MHIQEHYHKARYKYKYISIDNKGLHKYFPPLNIFIFYIVFHRGTVGFGITLDNMLWIYTKYPIICKGNDWSVTGLKWD